MFLPNPTISALISACDIWHLAGWTGVLFGPPFPLPVFPRGTAAPPHFLGWGLLVRANGMLSSRVSATGEPAGMRKGRGEKVCLLCASQQSCGGAGGGWDETDLVSIASHRTARPPGDWGGWLPARMGGMDARHRSLVHGGMDGRGLGSGWILVEVGDRRSGIFCFLLLAPFGGFPGCVLERWHLVVFSLLSLSVHRRLSVLCKERELAER